MLRGIKITKMVPTDVNAEQGWFRQVFESSPDPTWIIDGNRFLECNQAAVRTLGYTNRDALLNVHPSKLSPPWQPDGEESFAKAERMMALARDQGFHRFEWIHTKADGSNFIAEVTLVPAKLEDRQIIYCVWRDIAERKKADKALRESEKHIRLLFNSGNDPIFVYEVDSVSGAPLGHFVEVNNMACFRLGYSREELLRMRPEDIIAPEAAAHPAPGVKLAFRREAIYESFHLTRGGKVVPVEVNAHLFELYDKALVFAMARDITERKQSEAALRDSETRFRLTFELAGSGIAHVSLDGRLLRVNRSLCAILGYAEQELAGRTVKELSHPEDRDLTDAARARVLSGELESTRFQKRYLRKNGATVWVDLTVALARDAEGKPLYEIVVFDDVTERRMAEQALRESAEKLRIFSDNIPAMTVAFDKDLHYLFANKRYADFFGFAATDIIGKHLREIIGEDAYAAVESRFVQVLQGRPVSYQRTLKLANGESCHIEIKLLPHFDEHGTVLGCFAVTTDITEHKLTQEHIQRVAHHDNLTGLPNRLLFNDRLGQALSLAKRDSRQFALLYLDLDKFKPVNDALGHTAGDELLQAVAERIRRQVRESDTVARVGGDEFTVILPDIAARGEAEIVAKKIIAALAAPFELGSRKQWVDIGTSIGVAIYPFDGRDADTLIKAADAAMYSAKQAGSRVCFCADQPGPADPA